VTFVTISFCIDDAGMTPHLSLSFCRICRTKWPASKYEIVNYSKCFDS